MTTVFKMRITHRKREPERDKQQAEVTVSQLLKFLNYFNTVGTNIVVVLIFD